MTPHIQLKPSSSGEHACRNEFSHKNVFCRSLFISTINFYLSISIFLGPNLQYMEVPKLGVESELQLPAYDTATAMPDPNHVCSIHHRLMAMLDSYPSKQGQGWNPHPHGY